MPVPFFHAAVVIDAGHRLRVTIAGAGTPHHDLYPNRNQANAPTIAVFGNRDHGSYVELPLMKAK